MKIAENNKQGRVGSFWHNTPALTRQSEVMANTVNAVNPRLKMEELIRRVLKQTLVPINNFEIPVAEPIRIGLVREEAPFLFHDGEKSIRVLRQYPGSFPEEQGVPLGDKFVLIPSSVGPTLKGVRIEVGSLGGDTFLVEVPYNLKVESVLTKEGEPLIRDEDFDSDFGVIVFRKDPRVLFGEVIHILRAWKQPNDLYGYRSGTQSADDTWIYTYLSRDQSAESFKRAVAAAAGLKVIPRGGRLLYREGGFYAFDWGDLRVDYPHTPLEEGANVEAGDVIGDLTLHSGPGEWWHLCPWPEGLPLNTLYGAGHSLKAPYAQGLLKAVSFEGNTHLEIGVSGNPQEVENFHKTLWRGEARSKNFLSQQLGMSPGDEKSVNVLDFFMRYGFGRSLLRFDISGAFLVDQAKSISRFINAYRPVGSRTMLQVNDG